MGAHPGAGAPKNSSSGPETGKRVMSCWLWRAWSADQMTNGWKNGASGWELTFARAVPTQLRFRSIGGHGFRKKYRFTRKFGSTKSTAFSAVKAALLSLIENGETSNFEAIEDNPLSQMFKAKILSLYFPETYLNVCSSEHLLQISTELGLPEDLPSSKYQNLLLGLKSNNEISKDWSNPKFMSFLYAKVINQNLETSITKKLIKPKPESVSSPNNFQYFLYKSTTYKVFCFHP